MPTGVFPRTPEHVAALRAGLQKYIEAGGKTGRAQVFPLAVVLTRYEKAETALRAAVAREIKEGITDPELLRRAVALLTR